MHLLLWDLFVSCLPWLQVIGEELRWQTHWVLHVHKRFPNKSIIFPKEEKTTSRDSDLLLTTTRKTVFTSTSMFLLIEVSITLLRVIEEDYNYSSSLSFLLLHITHYYLSGSSSLLSPPFNFSLSLSFLVFHGTFSAAWSDVFYVWFEVHVKWRKKCVVLRADSTTHLFHFRLFYTTAMLIPRTFCVFSRCIFSYVSTTFKTDAGYCFCRDS